MKEEQEETKEQADAWDARQSVKTAWEVCPNRANIAIQVPGMEKHQIIHVDYLCNECSNCKSFCPYSSAPYLDKIHTFSQQKQIWKTAESGICSSESRDPTL